MAITRGHGLAVSSFHNMFITVWRQQANLESLRLVRECQTRLVRAYPKGVAVVTVMEPVGGKMLDSPTRAEAGAIARDFAANTLASAYVFEGEGFVPAMSRASVAGVLLLTRAKYPNKVFSNVADGIKWLAPILGPEFDGGGLSRAVEEARANLP